MPRATLCRCSHTEGSNRPVSRGHGRGRGRLEGADALRLCATLEGAGLGGLRAPGALLGTEATARLSLGPLLPVTAANELACRGLDHLEEKIPALQYPPEKVSPSLFSQGRGAQGRDALPGLVAPSWPRGAQGRQASWHQQVQGGSPDPDTPLHPPTETPGSLHWTRWCPQPPKIPGLQANRWAVRFERWATHCSRPNPVWA